jgi:hypothetical protein
LLDFNFEFLSILAKLHLISFYSNTTPWDEIITIKQPLSGGDGRLNKADGRGLRGRVCGYCVGAGRNGARSRLGDERRTDTMCA